MMKQGSSGNPMLIEKIVKRMQQNDHQVLSFFEFMNMCLYDPQHGYYTSDRVKIGKEGDFYTSASIGTVMGEMLTHYCVPYMERLFAGDETIHLTEWGGGEGRLAKHMLDECRLIRPDLYERLMFTSVEASAFHRSRQQEALAEHVAHVRWLTPSQWFEQREQTAIVFSNELLDAFPVHRAIYQQDEWFEIMVGWDEEQQRFVERLLPLMDEQIRQFITDEKIQPMNGQRIEVNLSALQWIKQVAQTLHDGVLISIDYGAEGWELYAPHRMDGTLLCYRQHQAHDDPYRYIGEQDITAHVNFSACIRTGLQAGFNHWALSDQKTFLVEAGILQKLKDHTSRDPFHPQVRINRSIRQILWSDQMSELFKVLVQSKSLSIHTKEGPESDA